MVNNQKCILSEQVIVVKPLERIFGENIMLFVEMMMVEDKKLNWNFIVLDH